MLQEFDWPLGQILKLGDKFKVFQLNPVNQAYSTTCPSFFLVEYFHLVLSLLIFLSSNSSFVLCLWCGCWSSAIYHPTFLIALLLLLWLLNMLPCSTASQRKKSMTTSQFALKAAFVFMQQRNVLHSSYKSFNLFIHKLKIVWKAYLNLSVK